MENLRKHFYGLINRSATEKETTSERAANESKKLCVEFADYYMQQGFRSDRKPLETTEEYFNEFLEQYKF